MPLLPTPPNGNEGSDACTAMALTQAPPDSVRAITSSAMALSPLNT